MPNKVTFGLEQVHIAIQGVAQTEQIDITAGATTDGEITVTVTSAAVTGSPVSVVVPLASETHDTAAKVASAIVNALNNNAPISAALRANNLAAKITLTRKVVAANDATLEIAVTPGTTGVTAGASTPGAAGTTGWGVPQPVPGAVRWTPSTVGDSSTFYADNTAYFVATANNGYTGELEMALVPDAVLADILGWEIDTNGALIEVSDGSPKKFALMGQVQGDEKNRRFVYYDCQASRPAKERTTKNESITPSTDVLNLAVSPISLGGKMVVKGDLELSNTNATAYNAFFNTVYVPAFS